jgi:uncharacterized protein (TIGR00369 family)
LTSEGAIAPGDIRVGGRRIVITPHHCFACGSLNVHGLKLELHAGEETCWTELVLPGRFQGWEGMAHGGIVCTILDEVMAWALVEHDLWGVTARMQVDFRRPVPIGRRIRGEGRMLEARRRLVRASGRIIDPEDGTVLATAEATFLGATQARKAELKARYAFRLEPEPSGRPASSDRERAGDRGASDTPRTGEL